MVATNLRFVILGDDKGSPAFDRFARSVGRANRAADQNRTVLQRMSAQSEKTGAGVAKLTGTITGFSDATTAASRNNGMFARGMSVLSLATGLLEPQMAGLLVTVGATSSAFAAGAIGLGAYGLAAKSSISAVTKAMQAQQAWMASKTPAAARKYHQALKALNPEQLALMKGLKDASSAYRTWGQRLARPVLRPLVNGLRLVRPLLHALTPAVRASADALTTLGDDVARGVSGGGFAKWIRSMRPVIFQTIVDGGHSVINIIRGIGGVLKAFAPQTASVTGGLEKLTEKFAKWGQTLSSHSGFRALIKMFKQDTPVVNQVLRNLVVIITNVAKAMAGFSSPSNSLGLLQTIRNISGIIAKLSENKQLLNLVLTFALWASIAKRVTGPLGDIGKGLSGLVTGFQTVKKGVLLLGQFQSGFTNANAAASAFSGTAGTLGGKLRSGVNAVGGLATSLWGVSKAAVVSSAAWVKNTAVLVASKTATLAVRAAEVAQAAAVKAAAAAQWLWNAAMDANPIGLVIIAVAALVAAVIFAYKHFKWFRDFVKAVWRDVRAWTVGTWHVVLGVIKAVWGWIRSHWPLLLGILTGPIGAAAIVIIRHRDAIWNGIRAVWNWIRAAWNRILGWITAPFRAGARFIGQRMADIRGAAKAVWNWIASAWHRIEGWLISPFKKAWHVIKGIWDAIASIIHKITSFGGSAPGGGGSGGGVPGRYTGPGGSPQAIAAAMMPNYGWSAGQMPPLISLWNQESGWRWNAQNPTSGAYGIPQSLPASKMASAGSDWRTNPATQIRWGLGYIKGRYGSPSGAWAHEQSFNWYGKGGAIREPVLGVGLRTGRGYGFGEKGRSEYVGGSDMNKQLDQVIAALGELTAAVYDSAGQNAADTANGIADALGAAGRKVRGLNQYAP